MDNASARDTKCITRKEQCLICLIWPAKAHSCPSRTSSKSLVRLLFCDLVHTSRMRIFDSIRPSVFVLYSACWSLSIFFSSRSLPCYACYRSIHIQNFRNLQLLQEQQTPKDFLTPLYCTGAIETKSLEVLERLEDHEITTGHILYKLYGIHPLFDSVLFMFLRFKNDY